MSSFLGFACTSISCTSLRQWSARKMALCLAGIRQLPVPHAVPMGERVVARFVVVPVNGMCGGGPCLRQPLVSLVLPISCTSLRQWSARKMALCLAGIRQLPVPHVVPMGEREVSTVRIGAGKRYVRWRSHVFVNPWFRLYFPFLVRVSGGGLPVKWRFAWLVFDSFPFSPFQWVGVEVNTVRSGAGKRYVRRRSHVFVNPWFRLDFPFLVQSPAVVCP